MPRMLILLPHPLPADGGGYIAVTRQGERISVTPAVAAGQLPLRSARVSECVAIIPAQALSWHRVTLPRGTLARGGPRSAHARAVMQGLLEDRLLQEPENVLFAVEPEARDEEPVWVAACDAAWLDAVVQPLRHSGRVVHRVVPEFEPDGQGAALTATGADGRARLVLWGEHGVTALPLPAAWPAESGWDWLGALHPQALELAVEDAARRTLPDDVLAGFPGAIRRVSTGRRLYKRRHSRWEFGADATALSGARATAGGLAWWRDAWRSAEWRPARLALGALTALQLVVLPVWAWREKASVAQREQALRASAQQAFPQLTVVLDAPRQMARELADLRRHSTLPATTDFEAQLGALVALSAGSAGAPGGRVTDAQVTELRYAEGQLTATLPASDPAAAQSAVRQLAALGYQARYADGQWQLQPVGTGLSTGSAPVPPTSQLARSSALTTPDTGTTAPAGALR